MKTALLDVNDLRVAYPGRGFRTRPQQVLHGVSLAVDEGETLGIVGESGSGKTTIGRAVLGLVKPSSGRIGFLGQDITHCTAKERRALARYIQVVFQDPYTSLNPSLTVGDILSEPLVVQGASPRNARVRVRELLDEVGLPADAFVRLPREFSGGQRQRVAIARALAPGPKLIVCDEPVSALDLSTQARVLDLFVDIQRRTGVAYLFVSHDLAVIRHVSHRVSVVHRGGIVETGPAGLVTSAPEHPYTQRLLLAAPVADPVGQRKRREERQRLAAARNAL
ncbi:ATP-binding cassette domain-containing protein [Streptomyces sp. NBC_01340]|uniref:ATP-binding cassette domain-containing protein n=1 Tax=unclassified Streptomyces TaxID=2593676 RepID=UPI0022536C6C|nr:MULTISPECIES: ATP-binding cassette domain-containing protein [unclassified Streptomyces]MCX4459415.1 ATP-binding cassette domain-containing protein [Streptomyces sp. NBC_01719]MCX4498772.1 ATP-binding cassette domain-containing protein [Streptomyces sp. NBC_01728]MCX4595324.1 ATP-binding cassette domain-containing protein [Streptomyces sp. NBC_01549]WSI43238.1 ATP-binding cassette domain-containing protein [Streptomyces sp. NBC_01340]